MTCRMQLAIFAGALLCSANASARVPNIELVEELGHMEVYQGHLVHAGRLWETRSRELEQERHRVDVFNPTTLALEASIELDHTATFIQPYGANQVVVVGKNSVPSWHTYYTIIRRQGTTYQKTTVTLPMQYQIDDVIGDGTHLFFTEPGDASIYQLVGRTSLRSVGGTVSGPGHMSLDGNSLWAVERHTFEIGDENLVHIDLTSGVATRIFTDFYRLGLNNVLALQGSPWVATSETAANQILLINKTTKALEHTIPVSDAPVGLTQVGGCLVTTAVDSKTVHFIALWGEVPHEIDQWDASGAGDRLKKPTSIAIDQESRRVFLRSSYLCANCATTQSSVFSLKDETSETIQECLAH